MFLKNIYEILFLYCDRALFAGDKTLKNIATLFKEKKYPSLLVPAIKLAIAINNLIGLKNRSLVFFVGSVKSFALNSFGKFDIIASGLPRVRHNNFSLTEKFLLPK